jgi:hypothetical protein
VVDEAIFWLKVWDGSPEEEPQRITFDQTVEICRRAVNKLRPLVRAGKRLGGIILKILEQHCEVYDACWDWVSEGHLQPGTCLAMPEPWCEFIAGCRARWPDKPENELTEQLERFRTESTCTDTTPFRDSIRTFCEELLPPYDLFAALGDSIARSLIDEAPSPTRDNIRRGVQIVELRDLLGEVVRHGWFTDLNISLLEDEYAVVPDADRYESYEKWVGHRLRELHRDILLQIDFVREVPGDNEEWFLATKASEYAAKFGVVLSVLDLSRLACVHPPLFKSRKPAGNRHEIEVSSFAQFIYRYTRQPDQIQSPEQSEQDEEPKEGVFDEVIAQENAQRASTRPLD